MGLGDQYRANVQSISPDSAVLYEEIPVFEPEEHPYVGAQID